jgi:peptidoglycan hydrolase CwlO-like protein
VYVTQEEYSSLVALLSAKDNQISSLKDQVEEGKKELLGLKERNTKLQKERDSLIIEKKDLLKATAVSYNSNKDGSNTPQTGNAEEGMISRREYEQFKKQYEMQENLLEGFQRENEKATVELEALKKR